MAPFRGATKGRARWLVAFTLLLLVASAVPVLADPPDEGQASAAESEVAGGIDPALVPDAKDLAIATEKVEAEEAARAAELEAPAAVAEREESEVAYKDVESAGAVSDLLRSSFSEELESLEVDPARFLTDAGLKRNLGNDGGAVVVNEGKAELMEAEIPAEVRDDDGELSKVNVSLKATSEGFEPANPIVELSVPASAAEGIEIEGGQTTIAQIGADPESAAHRFGDKDVIYPEVQTDTDLLVSPLSTGVEFFDQLRSPQSPETLRFDFDLPAGADLRANAGVAEVWEDGKMTASVSPPHAVDAQGTEVPVSMEVQGNSIVLSVAHREGDYAYPILVDPEYTQNNWVSNSWYTYHDYSALEDGTFATWNNNPGLKADRWCLYACWGSGRGLFASFPTNGYAPEQIVQWYYAVPGETSYLTGYLINPFFRDNHGCAPSQYFEPHDFDGIWSPVYGYYQLFTNRAQYTNAAFYGNEAKTVKLMVFGLNSGHGGMLPCWRDLYAGGVATYMTDPENPTLDPISGYPTGWIDDSKNYGVNVSAHDPGLGVANVRIDISEMSSVPLRGADCKGEHNSPCPRDMSGTIIYTADSFKEGKSQATVVAVDALQRPSNMYSWTTYADSTPPEVNLSGQLAEATKEEGKVEQPQSYGEDKLRLPVYKLKIDAEDGSKTNDRTMRSGVKNIEIYLDKKTTPESVPWAAQVCSGPQYSCPMSATYTLKLTELSGGEHTLKVIALDQLNHKRVREIVFKYIPATGMKDEYVTQYFPLPDGKGNEAEEEHPGRPELAVNVMNGNLIYREKDIDVPGYAADLEVERFYNSQLPDSQNTEWGDGWTLAQTPELEPEKAGVPKEADLIDASGAIEDGVQLPAETGKSTFNPALQATVTKEAGGAYTLTDESGETGTTLAFDSNGATEELRTGPYSSIDYDYEAGKLDEIAVKDPGSASDPSPAEEEAFEYIPPAPTYKTAIGSPGGAPGQLNAPADVALAPNGDLFVVDKGNNRIQRLSQQATFVSKFGEAGTGTGKFSKPSSIAIDSAGNLYVADTGNNRIQKFNEKGEFIKAIGSWGTGNGQFKEPEGIATDAKGNVYVADTYNQRIQKLNLALEFVSKFGTSGTGNGQFSQVNSIDVGPGGKIWATDWSLNRVTQFSETGAYVQKFGATGTGDGQFSHPGAIEVDTRGNVFVGDQSNNRVQQFSSSGKYLAKFGSAGTAEGLFSFSRPMGIAVDNLGGVWIADVSNNRIQKWGVANYRPSWYGAFGLAGTGDGQLKTPAGIALASNGDLFVLDRGNSRVERFNREGKFVSKFGSYGTGNGQLSGGAKAIAIDGSNNLWIADGANNRIEEFTESGEFIRAVGSYGTGNAQFYIPEGIATDLKGNVYVADTYNKRIQVFDEEGKFLFKFGSSGSGPGQFTEANAIDIGRHGEIWVADWGANRIEQFNEKGEFVQQFGSKGAGEGQFSNPDAIEADNKGNVWVGDQSNGRVQLFNEAGEYITQFGTKGSGEGQFSFAYPMDIAADSSGGLWITDVSNNRVQKWLVPSIEAPKPPEENDPSVDVKLSSGMVSGVEGDEAGVTTYTHTGNLLTSKTGPDGKTTTYAYDAGGRLSKVTLPNGTWGAITYNATYGRVSKVTVKPAGGTEKWTSFSYSDEPRRTTVTPQGETATRYDIGADGSVLWWQNVKAPPLFDNISGSIYVNKEKELPSGAQILEVQAHDEEGIDAIQILANGNQLVKEKVCEREDLETEIVECKTEKAIWVMEPENYPPGRLQLEVVARNRLGETAAERFWVTIPPPPPPTPNGAPARPKFAAIQSFREEFGLDVVDPPVDESEGIGRIFDLINAWTEGEPVARASWERWGVPLRLKDVAELEYREAYIEHDGAAIEEWAQQHAPSQYGGYFVNHAAGGIVDVGFTSNQSALLAELKSQVNLMAPSRTSGYPSPPLHAVQNLQVTAESIESQSDVNSVLKAYVVGIEVNEATNRIDVGATNVPEVENTLQSLYGASAPIAITQDEVVTIPAEPVFPGASRGRDHESGRIQAGDLIIGNHSGSVAGCTAGFGAWESIGEKSNGEEIRARFLLTASHCSDLGSTVKRSTYAHAEEPSKWSVVGKVNRTGAPLGGQHYETDAEAIRLDGGDLAPHRIQTEGLPERINQAVAPQHGQLLCVSGAVSARVDCGHMTGIRYLANDTFPGRILSIVVHGLDTIGGDSGAPLWNSKTGRAVGLLWARPRSGIGRDHVRYFIPLVKPRGFPKEKVPGALSAPGMGNLNLIVTP